MNDRRMDVAFFVETQAISDRNAYSIYANATKLFYKHGGVATQYPPILNPLWISISAFFPEMPQLMRLCAELRQGVTDTRTRDLTKLTGEHQCHDTAVLSIGITELSGSSTNVDGTYMKQCRPLLYNLRQRDIVSLVMPSPGQVVYTGIRLIDVYLRYLLDWLSEFEGKSNKYNDKVDCARLCEKSHIQSHIQPFRDAIDSLLNAVWEILKRNYQSIQYATNLCDNKALISLKNENILATALDQITRTFKAFFANETDSAVICLARYNNYILEAEHPLYVPIGESKLVFAAPQQLVNVKDQLEKALDNNEAEIRVLDTASGAISAVSGIILEPVFMSLGWAYRNEISKNFAFLGISLSIASILMSLLSYIIPAPAFGRYLNARTFEKDSDQNMLDYMYQVTFAEPESYADELNSKVIRDEQVQLHKVDYLVSRQVVHTARRRYIKRRLTSISGFLLAASLVSYSAALLSYQYSVWYSVILILLVIVIFGFLLYFYWKENSAKAKKTKIINKKLSKKS